MENRNWSNEQPGLPLKVSKRGGAVRQGIQELARRGLTRKLVDTSAQLAEKRLPRQLSRAFVLTQLGTVTRTAMLAEWGALGLMLLFGGSGLWFLISRNDNFFSTFLLALAALFFVVWKLVQRGRRFAEQQVLRAMGAFQDLVLRGELPTTAFPQWFRQWKSRQRRQRS